MKILNGFLWFGIVILVFVVLVVGKDILIPLVLAVFIWFFINALTEAFERIRIRGRSMPAVPRFIAAIVTILLISYFLSNLIVSNIADVIDVAPAYQNNLDRYLERTFRYLGMDQSPSIRELFRSIKLTSLVTPVAVGVRNLISNTGIIAIYLIFLLLEQRSFRRKLIALIRNDSKRVEVEKVIARIEADVRVYLGIKTLTSAGTGIASFIIMQSIGLDFAGFWAILIFLLNYIPTIGSIVATAFPSMLALVQFDSIYPFLVTAGGVSGLQIAIGNFIEPRLMGRTLNLSPLVILLSLGLWGLIWGIPGMILSVPIMVIALIVLSRFEQTKPIAIILSRDGTVRMH